MKSNVKWKEYIEKKRRSTKWLEKMVVKIYGENGNEFCIEASIEIERENINQM